MPFNLEHEITPIERLRLIAEAVGSVPDNKIYLKPPVPKRQTFSISWRRRGKLIGGR